LGVSERVERRFLPIYSYIYDSVCHILYWCPDSSRVLCDSTPKYHAAD